MPKPNIVLITIDCLRFDRLGCYGNSRNISPNIDSLASMGALFLQEISNGGRTPDSFPSIMASQLPPLSPEEYGQLMQRGPTLAALLRESGYQTAAFHSNPFLAKFFHYDNGFDVFEDDLGILNNLQRRRVRLRLARKGKGFSKLRNQLGAILNIVLYSLGKQRDVTAESLTKRAVSWLNTCTGSFFLWPHYMDAHNPYLPPMKYVRRFCKRRVSRYRMIKLHSKQIKTFRNAEIRKADWLSPAEIDTLAQLYDANIRYVDDNIGRFIDSLGSRLEETLVIVTADHGEAFGEHNWLGHGSTLYEELLRVPLIMVGPGIKAGTVVKETVELIDLAPTVAELVGIGSVEGFRGKSLLSVMKGNQKTSEGTISTIVIPEFRQRLISYRKPEWKYIRTESLDDTNTVLMEELYDLSTDSQERHNLHGSGDEKARVFELAAINKIQEFKQLKGEEKTAYERERIRARLKKLNQM